MAEILASAEGGSEGRGHCMSRESSFCCHPAYEAGQGQKTGESKILL